MGGTYMIFEVDTIKTGDEMVVKLDGRLDRKTSPELEHELEKKLSDDVKELDFDFEDLINISSAGLNVLLEIQKRMKARGGIVKIKHARSFIVDVFDITGISEQICVE